MISKPDLVCQREQTNDIEITIFQYQQGSDFYVRAINIANGATYGPTKIYEQIDSSIVEKNLPGTISIHEVADNLISLNLPIIKTAVQLDINNANGDHKKMNLLDFQVQKLTALVHAQDEKIKTLEKALERALQKPLGVVVEKPLDKKTYYGATKVEDWVEYGKEGICVTVDIKHLGLRQTPHIVSSIHGKGNHWITTGATSIYVPCKDSFKVYVRAGGCNALELAQKNNWHLNYIVNPLD